MQQSKALKAVLTIRFPAKLDTHFATWFLYAYASQTSKDSLCTIIQF